MDVDGNGEGAVGGEGSSSDDDENDDVSVTGDILCADGKHKWAQNVCMICTVCEFCTGYGRGCCNDGKPDRTPGG